MRHGVAIVGLACRFPDASSPGELWENVLTQRRSFRRIPPERLRLDDYYSADTGAADGIYSTEGAFIEGYEFDRLSFRVTGSAFRATDMTQWLALDVASAALADAGFHEGAGLPRESTGVFMGNTLAGEFARAGLMRLRWPFVRRVAQHALAKEDWTREQRQSFLSRLERAYKKPFPTPSEETLPGGLSNTIAGRICNHFDLNGGGYTLDGACASSLLAVINACACLEAGDVDVAIAGGVDLSVDPFELVGFARVGALAAESMRVYDARSSGFWPGEGCGVVVLMRHRDALAARRRVFASIRGWGVSSDGAGGITRPEVEGQMLALRRAYKRAGFGIETVDYFEGHGTGTSVGDAVELKALSRARREASPVAVPAAIGSVKANIGHTKAAAGVAGLIKAVMALNAQILPPTTSCEDPHPELKGNSPALRVLGRAEPWPRGRRLRAGVSAMGFGGVNAHLVLEAARDGRRRVRFTRKLAVASAAQDAELFLFGAGSADELSRQVERVLNFAGRLSRGELTDLAARLAGDIKSREVRAAVVASTPMELAERLKRLKSLCARGTLSEIDPSACVFMGVGRRAPRIGLLFPGQGSPLNADGGAWARRFESVRELYVGAPHTNGGPVSTAVAQPAIVRAAMAALRVLKKFGVKASVAVGHSLGELCALHWAGALSEQALLRTAQARGKAMEETSGMRGAMVSFRAGSREVEEILNGEPVVIAGLNSPLQTILSGEAGALASVTRRAEARGLECALLPVQYAFHSPLMAAAVQPLAVHLASEEFGPPRRRIVSSITGTDLQPGVDLRQLLSDQLTSPVRFMEAISVARLEGVNLWIEAGTGRTLCGLLREFDPTPAIALDACGTSLRGLLKAIAACFVLGAQVRHAELFAGRRARRFDLDWCPKFFTNPCELAPLPEAEPAATELPRAAEAVPPDDAPEVVPQSPQRALEIVRRFVAERAELPLSAVKDETRLLEDLHLNSIVIGQLVTEATRCLNLTLPVPPTHFADASLAEIADALEGFASTEGGPAEGEKLPPGVDTWVRPFTVELVGRPLPGREPPPGPGAWRVAASPGHPMKGALERAFGAMKHGRGIVVALPPSPDESHIRHLLTSAREALGGGEGFRYVLVQHGGGAAAFARTLHQEAQHLVTCVVDVPQDHPQAAGWICAEALAAKGYTEAHYDSQGTRREPVLRPLLPGQGPPALPLGADDVLAVTGGARGITAECALALARETGARLALIGSSLPVAEEVAANLERFRAAGVLCRYYQVDVTDAGAVRAATREIESGLGRITGIIHGAARNVPCLIGALDEKMFSRTLGPKVLGARNLLAAVDAQALRLFISFGSVIARVGLRGEADYALANEWLTRLTEEWQSQHPHCRCLAVEWSVWSGVGMGARLGGITELERQGVSPIAPEQGIASLRELLCLSIRPTSAVVMGRFPEMQTLKLATPELPFRRFLEKPLVYYPRVELVAEAELSSENDPYLEDHVLQGERLLPGVMSMEAAAQAAMALMETAAVPAFERVEFKHAVVVAPGKANTIRLAALARDKDRVEVVLRSSETGFQVDHFSAICNFARQARSARRAPALKLTDSPHAGLQLDPGRDLYGQVLFHRGRFQRVCGYRRLRARGCVAEIAPDGVTKWFSQYLPGALVLGDPGARDAAIHAVQACIPHVTLLPVSARRIARVNGAGHAVRYVRARERVQHGDSFIYDLELMDEGGAVVELWEGLCLRAVGNLPYGGPWAAGLLGTYIERRVCELTSGSASLALVESGPSVPRRARSDLAMQIALGEELAVLRRADGKPEVWGGREVSASHSGNLTLALAGRGIVACDIEQVNARTRRDWQGLLDRERFHLAEIVCREASEAFDAAATRVWAAAECLKKAGAGAGAPLVLAGVERDGWVLLSSGRLLIASYVTRLRGHAEPFAIAALVETQTTST